MKGLSPRQAEVLRFLAAEIAHRGYAPTLAEVSRRFGWTSHNAARDHLLALEKKGWVAVRWGQARAIRVVAPALDVEKAGPPVLLRRPDGGVALFWPIAASDPALEETPALAHAS